MKRRPITITHHAIQRYRERLRDPSATLWEVEAKLKAEINEAYDAGRSQNHKTKRFKLYKESKRMLPSNERFLWREDETMAWIVRDVEGKLLVMTTLKPAWGFDEDAA